MCVEGLGLEDVPPAGHALGAEVGGSIIFVTTGGIAVQPIKFVGIFVRLVVVSFVGSRIC